MKRMNRAGVSSLAGILLVVFFAPISSWPWQTPNSQWAGNETTMSLNLSDPWNSSAEDALHRWNSVLCSSFTYYFNNENHDHCDRGTVCVGTDGNAVEWDDFSNGLCGDPADDALAIARTNWISNYCNADVLFNSQYAWTTSPREYTIGPPYNFNSVAIHEFGHTLGLGHEDRWLATMNSIYHANDRKIHADDRGGIRSLYGPSGVCIEVDIAPSSWKKQNTSDAVAAALVSSPSLANPGQTVNMEWTQENHGTGSTAFDIGFYLSANKTISAADTLLATNSGASQNRNSSGTYSRNVIIPADLPEGTYWLGVILDYNNKVAESNESNNALAHPRSIFIEDNTNPTPDPMTWSSIPHETGTSAIAMAAATANDATPPVRYHFDFVGSTTGGSGGSGSGWQAGTSYADTGLQTNHEYGYRVRARDGASSPNYTRYSSYSAEYTDIEAPTGIAFGSIYPNSIGVRSINTPSGLNRGNSGLLFECWLKGDSGWRTSNSTWIKAGLSVNTLYYFRAKARNGDADETPWTAWYTRYTEANTPGAPLVSNPTLTSLDVSIAPNGNLSYTECVIRYNENGTFYYLDAGGTKNLSPVWQSISTWGTVTATGLLSGNSYCSSVKARNGDGLETSWSPTTCLNTTARTITVNSPNGGEAWLVADSKFIEWSFESTTGNVKIELSRNGGTSWALLTASTPNDGSFAWTVSGPASANCRVRITSLTYPETNDESDALFTILQPVAPCPGDFNADGLVNDADLAVLASHFGRSDCGTPPCMGDFPQSDSDVDGQDLALFTRDFGRTDCP